MIQPRISGARLGAPLGARCGALLATLAALATLAPACVGELPAPPAPPTIVAPTLVNHAQVALRGTKPASTAIELSDGTVLVPLDEDTSWRVDVTLRAGTNAFSVLAVDALDARSTAVSASVVLDADAPDAPVLDPFPQTTLRDEVTLSGTKGPGDRLEVNGAVRPTGSADNAEFSIDVALAPGTNRLRVATLDQAGNESPVVELTVERADEVPFTVDPVPAAVPEPSLTLAGTRGAGVEVVVDGTAVVPAADLAGPWSTAVTLVAGANSLEVSGRIAREPESTRDVTVTVFLDDLDPTLDLVAPVSGDFVTMGTLTVNGTVADASGVTVEVCVGTCSADVDFAAAPGAAGAFSLDVDLAARTDLDDGAVADVVVRATDAVQHRTTLSTPILLGRAPVTLPGAASVALAAGGLYVEARAFVDATGAAQVQLDLDGPPWAPDTAILSDGAAITAAAPRVVWLPGGAAALVLEDSPATSLSPGEPGLVYAEVTPAGATRAVVTQGDVGAAVGSADLALGSTGTLLAFSQGDEVRLVAETAGGLAFGAPATVSDASTLTPGGVRLLALSATRVVVMWQETSDRDGTLDDADVVARVVDEAGVAVGPIVLLSGGAGDASDPALVGGGADSVILAWLQGGNVLAGSVTLDELIAGTAPGVADLATATGAGSASAFSLATSGTHLAVCWLDDGPALVGANGPGLVVRTGRTGLAGLGAAALWSAGPVVSADCALDAEVLHGTWIVSGTAYLQPRVIP